MNDVIYFYYDKVLERTILVLEKGKSISEKLPVDLLNDACLQAGSNYKGSKESFSLLTGATQKIPICTSILKQVIFFPTMSEKHAHCVYIQYRKIRRIKRIDNLVCCIEFHNGIIESFACSERVIKRQMQRCEAFLNHIMDL